MMHKIEANDELARGADGYTENVRKLKELFPELVTEGPEGLAVNVDVLKSLVGDKTVTDAQEKFGLNWHGKRLARQLALTPSLGTLRPCKGESVDWDTTQNLMIEGDNLEVLKLLKKSYAGKVKLIYIDPPYNTGSDFVYPDKFGMGIEQYKEITSQAVSSNPETSGRFHTDWLNMMYPRLKLARELLRDDGVIMISIDDAEIQTLMAQCAEVFGQENKVACMIWEKGRKNDAKFVSVGHEYLLIYAKSQARLRELKTVWREEKPGAREIWECYQALRARHKDDDRAIERDLSAWYSGLPDSHPSKKWSRYKRVDKFGPWRDRDISWPGGGGPRYDVIHPTTGLPCAVPEAGWRFSSPDEMSRQIELGLVVFRDDHTSPPFRKAHIRPVPAEAEIAEDEQEEQEDAEEFATQVRGSYFYKQSQVAVRYLRTLLGAKVFDNPKDHLELAKLFSYVTPDCLDGIFLDFFGGSGTTGEAIYTLNQGDGGNRRFVLVQLPEVLDPKNAKQKAAIKYLTELGRPLTIAEITKERLRRAGAVSSGPDHGLEDQLGLRRKVDLGFRVFKLDSTNIAAWDPKPADLGGAIEQSLDHLKTERGDDDVLYEILLKHGLDLSLPIAERQIAGKTVYSVGAGTLLACLDRRITKADAEPLALGMIAWLQEMWPDAKDLQRERLCVFRDAAFAGDDVAKTNLAAILEQNGLADVRSL